MSDEATTPAAEDTARVDTAPEVDVTAETPETDSLDENADPGAEGDDPEGEGKPAIETEEIEHDGKKYAIPKELKGAFLMHKDYTQKTQEIADARREVEARAKTHAESFQALTTEYGAVHAAQTALDAFGKISQSDWDALRASDPDQYRELRDEFRDARDRLEEAKNTLRQKEGERLQTRSQHLQAALKETGAELARTIPGWSRETAEKVTSFVAQHGITAQELHETTDPRLWRLFHLAMTQSEGQSKATQAANHAKAAEITPAKTVTARTAAPAPLSDRASVDEWMKAREAQVRKRA